MLGKVLVKVEKKSILHFTENIIKDLFIRIMEIILKEMETNAGINFEPIWDNDLKYTCNFAKEFYQKIL